jgi:hypothetical protein
VPKDADVGVLARIFLFADMRGGFTFEGDKVTGMAGPTFDDLVTFMDKARGTRARVILSLLDFHICDEKCGMLWDDGNVQAFMDTVVVPLLKRIADHPSVFAIEPVNEPEWAIKESGRAFTKQHMSAWNAQSLSARINAAVHQYTPFLTVDGSGSAMWSQFWTDAAMKAAYPDGGDAVTFDFHGPHMYPFSAPDFDVFSKPPSSFHMGGKRVIIGESGKNDPLSIQDKFQKACEQGYAGFLPWSAYASDGVATWDDIRPVLENFKGCPKTS